MSDRIAILKTIGLLEAMQEIAHRNMVKLRTALELNKSPSHARARREMCWYLRQKRMSYPEIGNLLGMDHTTVIHHCQRAAAEERGSSATESSTSNDAEGLFGGAPSVRRAK